MKGDSFISHIPIGKSALDIHPNLRDWISSWFGSAPYPVEFLDANGWFERGHDLTGVGSRNIDNMWIPNYIPGAFVWAPPSADRRIASSSSQETRFMPCLCVSTADVY